MAASVRSHPSSPGDEDSRRLLCRQVAQLASYAFDVPLALARVGDVSASAGGEEGDVALVPADLHAVSQRIESAGAPIVIEDTAEDERLALSETGIRFVAIVPIRGVHRQRIGALSIADTSPRTFAEEDVEHLRMLVTLTAESHLYPLEGVTHGPSLQHIVQRMDQSLVVTDPGGRIAWVNRGFERLCGYTLAELRGRKPKELLHGPETDPATLATMRAHVQAGTGFSSEVVNYRKSGESYRVRIQAEPIEEAGTLAGFIAVETEVSEQQVSYETLQMERDVLESAVDTVDALIVLLDPEARILHFSEGCRRVTGYEASEVVGEPMVDLHVPEEERARVRAVMEAHRAGRTRSAFTCHWLTKTGERRRIDWTNTAFTDAHGTVQRIISTGIDVTEQHQLETYALQVRESEQRRLGETLHDLLASQLMGTAMTARGLEQRAEAGQAATDEDLRVVVNQIQDAAHQLQTLSRTVRPDTVQRRGLGEALRRLGADKEVLTGLSFHVEVEPGLPPIEEATAMQLYRLVRDVIDGAVQYIGVSRVAVRLAVEGEHVALIVQHDGRSLPEATARSEKVEMRLMQRRAASIGAELSRRRTEQGEPVVRCVLPVGDVGAGDNGLR